MRPFTGIGLILFLFVSQATKAQSVPTTLKIGDSAPPIGNIYVLGADRIEPAMLRGKVVVVEFWATWCAPCVEAIPHMNELVEKTSGQPFAFLSVTDEEEERVRKFLEKRPIQGWVVLDPARSLFEAFHSIGIPHAVVIGPDGRIAAVTTPKELTLDALQRVAAGQNAGLPVKDLPAANLEWDREEVEWRDGIKPISQVLIKPIRTYTGGQWYQPGGSRYVADGATLPALVQGAFQIHYYYLDYRLPVSEQQYRVSVVVPEDRKERLLPILQQALQATFGFRTRWEEQERDVYILELAAGATIVRPSTAEKEQFWFMRGTIHGRKQPLAKLHDALTNFLRRPIVDETNLNALYDWQLSYDVSDTKVLIGEVRSKLGLELVPARRKVRMLVIEPESSP